MEIGGEGKSSAILIDPTLFDDVHNILDIVLANMYQNFTNKYKDNNNVISEDEREMIIDQFQKVYFYSILCR